MLKQAIIDPRIRAVAAALVEHRHLTADAVARVCRQ
jgi:hypothetical protein